MLNVFVIFLLLFVGFFININGVKAVNYDYHCTYISPLTYMNGDGDVTKLDIEVEYDHEKDGPNYKATKLLNVNGFIMDYDTKASIEVLDNAIYSTKIKLGFQLYDHLYDQEDDMKLDLDTLMYEK